MKASTGWRKFVFYAYLCMALLNITTIVILSIIFQFATLFTIFLGVIVACVDALPVIWALNAKKPLMKSNWIWIFLF